MSTCYAATVEVVTKVPAELIAAFTGKDVVNCLRTQYLPYLDEMPFMFSAEANHVWQVLRAMEAVLDNNYTDFSQDKEGNTLGEGIFSDFVSLAHELQEDAELVRQMWIVVFLHDIAKYSVQNADHARIGGDVTREAFEVNHFSLNEQERKRIAWIIGNHDVVGNIVSSAERAPRCLTEHLENLSDKEKCIRLNMLILLSFCDLRGTVNGKFVNDDNARSRFWAADSGWLEQKEKNLFGWRKERLVRASTPKDTVEKQKLWDATFSGLQVETKLIIERQFGNNIKVFTNLLYLALGLNGEELLKLVAVISLMAEMATGGKPNPHFQGDFTEGAERERDKPTPIIDGIKTVLKKIRLDELTLVGMTDYFKSQTIHGMQIEATQDRLVIHSRIR